ncbi:SH3 domain-containing protein [Streptomyces sp. NPDC049597]|uniref:SH3 domain-containing protein n=1 Tax=Streptomyces sp. NPDC049597 TaxID=3155276 RepID=UPI00342DE45B
MRFRSRVVAVVSSVVLAMGGASLAVAPAASAVSIPSQCQFQWNEPRTATTISAVHLRTGPGTFYTSLGILARGTGFTHYSWPTPTAAAGRGGR